MSSPVMLITANVGSIFEDPQVLLKIWIREFLATVSKIKPKFFALHCQEVGGKNYEQSMTNVDDFIRTLMASMELLEYDRVRVLLDEDFTCSDKFTALGNLYFIHNSLKDVMLWNFRDNRFCPVIGKEVHSGNIEEVAIKEKTKFLQEFFPECKWSRKGYMRTKWLINNNVIDLVNIHLFHDDSNFVSMETFPSTYAKNRRKALEYTLENLEKDCCDKFAFFLFGDFNFRLDTRSLIERITSAMTPIHIKSAKNGEVVKMLYRDPNNENKVMLTIEKRVFDYENIETFYNFKNNKWLLEFDREIEILDERLFEFDINFPPSYPFKEDLSGSTCYLKTRCPAWCDRILMNKFAQNLICSANNNLTNCHIYEMMGANVSMGDHKPIILLFNLVASKDSTHLNECKIASQSNSDALMDKIDIKSAEVSSTITRYVHVQCDNGSPITIFRETSV